MLFTAVIPRLIARWGSHRVVGVSLPASAGSLALLGQAGSLVALGLLLVLLGATTGALDVAMNANGVALQNRWGSSVFSRLHAMWSLGAFAGAGIGAIVTRHDVSIAVHLPIAAVVILAVGLVASTGLDADPAVTAVPTRSASWSRDPRVLVHAAFSLPHFGARVLGDPVVDRFGRRSLLAGCLLVAAVGYLLIVLSQEPVLALVGLGVAGAGIGLVVPVAFAAAGSVEGVPAGSGVATAAGVSYAGWTTAPPVIGGLAAVGGLRVGLLLPLILAAVAALTLTLRRDVAG
jgi:MFS family permease